MASNPLPNQLALEAQLGGPMQFHGLIAPALPADPICSRLVYLRHWQGEDQKVSVYNAPFMVPFGIDAVMLTALLLAPPIQSEFNNWRVVVTGEQLHTLIQEVNPLINLSATEIIDSLQRLRMAGVSIETPGARRRFCGFQFLDALQVSSRERVADEHIVFNEASLTLSAAVMSLHVFGTVHLPEKRGA
jgi:hypothetical protein